LVEFQCCIEERTIHMELDITLVVVSCNLLL
jgi:hypothetical protein